MARMAFEVLSNMDVNFVDPDKKAWTDVMNTRRQMALDILKLCADPKHARSSSSRGDVDQRWVHFFKRGLDISHNTLITTDISQLRVALVTQITQNYALESAFGNEDYLEQCKSG